MSCVNCLYKLIKRLTIFILIISIVLPLLYGSTNHRYIILRLFHSALSIKHSFIDDHIRPNLSSDYRAFEDILKFKPLLKRTAQEDPAAILKRIRAGSSMTNIVPKPQLCNITKEVFQHDGHSVDTFWVDNHQNKFQRHANHIIIYFHGGAYLLGDINSYSGVECYFSKLFNITILHVEYRLSPEHALPAAVEDTVAIYRALLQHNISPTQLMFMGDSAGGGLSLLTIQALLTHKLPVPRGVVVLSPWTDLSASGESHVRNRHTDILLHNDENDWLMEQLLGPNYSQLSHDSPIYSPLFGSFTNFPPMYINVGTAEILEDDSRRVYTKAREAGVDVTFEEGQHLMHCYPVFFPYYPEARQTLKNINEWIQKIYSNKKN